MAIDLKAVFRVQDSGSSKLRRIMQQTDKLSRSTQQATRASDNYRDSQGRLRNAMGRFVSDSRRATSANARFSTSLSGVRVGASGVSASLSGMQSALFGIVGAYVSAQGAAAAFNATIGAAAERQQQLFALEGMFQDADKAKSYVKMLETMAIDSPVLSTGDMMTNSKAFVGLSKDLGKLEEIWGLVERIQAFAGVDTRQAAFSTKELFQGDYVSIVDAIGLDKKSMQAITKMGTLEQKMKGLNKVLNDLGVNEDMVKRMGDSTKGQYSSMQEKFESFFAGIGKDGNDKLSVALKGVNEELDKLLSADLSSKLEKSLGTIVSKAIDVGKWMWKWREPISYLTGGLMAAVSAFMLIGTLSLLANPIALVAAAIAGAAVGMVALYKNSETFRGIIDSVKTKVSELWSAFKTGGAGGLLDSLFGGGTAEKVAGIVDKVKTKFGELKGGFSIVKDALAQGWSVISDVFSNAWTLLQPILSGLWSMLKVVGEYAQIAFNNIIAPALSFVMQLFSTLWAIAKPILTMIGGLFEVLGAVVTVVWKNILAPLMEFVTTAFSNAFNNLSGVLEIAAGWFDTLGRWANTAKGYLSDFASVIAGIKLPDWVTSGISTVVTTVGKAIGAGTVDGSHYHGLDYVNKDNYIARLHKGERVLTAQENKEYSGKGGINAGGITVNISGVSINNDSDIEKIAHQLATRLETEMFGRGI